MLPLPRWCISSYNTWDAYNKKILLSNRRGSWKRKQESFHSIIELTMIACCSHAHNWKLLIKPHLIRCASRDNNSSCPFINNIHLNIIETKPSSSTSNMRKNFKPPGGRRGERIKARNHHVVVRTSTLVIVSLS